MNTLNIILITGAAVGGIGVICGITLALAAKFLSVNEDPRIGEVCDLLPGANCGGCGYAGCADYAKAIVADNAPVNLCAPGGSSTLAAVSKYMGVTASEKEKMVAIVLCGGDNTKATKRAQYNGIADCSAAHSTCGGDKACSYGCLGYGSCARVCPVGAIEITEAGIAKVHSELCIGCGACVKACPRSIIKMIPESRKIHVLCSSKDKGPAVKKVCQVGCIGCTVCTKLADNEAIKMDGFLAVVDYSKELTNEVVVDKCPGKCIVKL